MSEFHKNLLKSIKSGLSEDEALASMTIHPAKICGISKYTGTLEEGKMANFFIVNGSSYFVNSPEIHSTWTSGMPDLFLNRKKSNDSNGTKVLSRKTGHANIFETKLNSPIRTPEIVLFQNFLPLDLRKQRHTSQP